VQRLGGASWITHIAKFARVLDSAKCRFGILFASNGISGAREKVEFKNALREIVKLHQDRGIVIIVL